MSQGGFVTLVGFVAMEPSLRVTKDGHHVADVRVGTATRMLDKQTGEWVDGDTSFYTVTCWRKLADHAKASLRKGDPVLVKGRFRTSSYEDKTGRLRTEVEIVADTVGHDLSRGIANYIRPERARQNATDDPAASGPAGGDPSTKRRSNGSGGNWTRTWAEPSSRPAPSGRTTPPRRSEPENRF